MSHYTRLRDLATNTDQNINLDTGDRFTRRADQTVAVYDKQITGSGGGHAPADSGSVTGDVMIHRFNNIGGMTNPNMSFNQVLAMTSMANATSMQARPNKTYRTLDVQMAWDPAYNSNFFSGYDEQLYVRDQNVLSHPIPVLTDTQMATLHHTIPETYVSHWGINQSSQATMMAFIHDNVMRVAIYATSSVFNLGNINLQMQLLVSDN